MCAVGRTKRCSKCGRYKACSQFSKDNASGDGLLNRCKTCDNLAREEHRSQTRVVSLKFCPACRKTRDAAEFNKNKRQADGLQTRCRECDKDWRDANKEKRAAAMKSWAERNQTCAEDGCDVLVYGTGHTRCDQHRPK